EPPGHVPRDARGEAADLPGGRYRRGGHRRPVAEADRDRGARRARARQDRLTERNPGSMTVQPARIRVATDHPYDVVIARGRRDELVPAVRDSSKAAIVHPPTLAARAEATRDDLVAAGLDAHRIEIPDAEDGKALSVAGFCWEVLGRIGLDRL